MLVEGLSSNDFDGLSSVEIEGSGIRKRSSLLDTGFRRYGGKVGLLSFSAPTATSLEFGPY
jgi:hypothetical protein